MKKIFIVDTIGSHTGMHLYNNLIINLLKTSFDVKVLSNYNKIESYKLFENFYIGNKISKIYKLSKSLFNFLSFYIKNDGFYIYESYGLRIIDMAFILLMYKRKKTIVLVHDMYPITKTSNFLTNIRILFYKNIVKNFITHSEKIKNDIRLINLNSNIIYTPHFRYSFDKKYYMCNIRKKIVNLISNKKINLLFFGSIRESKGLKFISESITHIKKDENAYRINIIIAGKNNENQLEKYYYPLSDKQKQYFSIFNDYVYDDEMKFLFQNTDYILLPYKEINQSGIMDIGIYYGKKIIFSNIEKFKNLILQYKTFGYIFNINDSLSLSYIYRKLKKNDIISKNDYLEYIKSYKEDEFLKNLEKTINNLKEQ